MGGKPHGVGEGVPWKRRQYFSFQRGKYGTTMVYSRFSLKRLLPWILAVSLGLVGVYLLIRR